MEMKLRIPNTSNICIFPRIEKKKLQVHNSANTYEQILTQHCENAKGIEENK